MCAETGKGVHIIISHVRVMRAKRQRQGKKKRTEITRKKGRGREKRGKERIKSKRTPVREKRKFGHPL